MKVTKKMVSEQFAELRKFGYKVYNCQDSYKWKMGKGMKGFSDYTIIGHGKIYFAEVKFKSTKDSYSDEQTAFRVAIENVSDNNPFVFYALINEDNYKDFYIDILQGKLKNAKCLKHWLGLL